jgi:hypothetical protein
MLRRILWLLCALVLSACTLAPDASAASPKIVCPTCAAATSCAQSSATATQLPTKTNTPVPPTQVPPTPTRTPVPPTAVPTATPQPSTATAYPTPPPFVEKNFQVQAGTPRQVLSFAHPASGCKWSGVAGQALGLDGKPVLNLAVVVTGSIHKARIDKSGLTGESTAYGPGGFEIQLADQAVVSDGSMFIQLFDLKGASVSYPVAFNTSSDCQKNLVLVNFKQVK